MDMVKSNWKDSGFLTADIKNVGLEIVLFY